MMTMPSQKTGTDTKRLGAESKTVASHAGFP